MNDLEAEQLSFGISQQQALKLEDWITEIYKKAYRRQVESSKPDSDLSRAITMFATEHDPYYGAIGGGISYTFTPTSLGTIVKVKEAITGEELDLTEYNDW